MVCSIHKARQYAVVSKGRNLSSLHLIISYSNCSNMSNSCRGKPLHSNQTSYKRVPSPPGAHMVLLRNNLVMYMHLQDKITLGRHSTQMILPPCPGRGRVVTRSDLKDVLWKETNTAGFAWCHLGEAVFITIAPHPHLMLVTTLMQVPCAFLPPLASGMGPLPLHHIGVHLSSVCDSVVERTHASCDWKVGFAPHSYFWDELGP